jgi:hypothetical protein
MLILSNGRVCYYIRELLQYCVPVFEDFQHVIDVGGSISGRGGIGGRGGIEAARLGGGGQYGGISLGICVCQPRRRRGRDRRGYG